MIHTLAGAIDQKEIVQTTVSVCGQAAISANHCLRSVHNYTSQTSYIRRLTPGCPIVGRNISFISS